jgi:hypothetical protein
MSKYMESDLMAFYSAQAYYCTSRASNHARACAHRRPTADGCGVTFNCGMEQYSNAAREVIGWYDKGSDGGKGLDTVSCEELRRVWRDMGG